MIWKLTGSALLMTLLMGCQKEPTIERAEYLEKIFPNYKNDKTFLVKSNYFNKPSCHYLQNWAKSHIVVTDKNIEEEYTFLKYDETLTLKKPLSQQRI